MRVSDVVFVAGLRCLTHIGETNGGQLPRTLPECRALPERYSLMLDFYDGGGKLVIMPDGQGVIYTNPTAPAIRQMCDIIHELSEWMAIENNPVLYDRPLPTTFHANGGSDPKDRCHQIALFAERVYRAWLETA